MVNIKRLHASNPNFNRSLQQLLAFENAMDASVDATVAQILTEIKTRGDAALVEYTNRFDQVNASSVKELELTQANLHQSLNTLPVRQRQALEQAAERIKSYHEKQVSESWQYRESDHTLLGPENHTT